MISDKDCAKLCNEIYNTTPDPKFWSHYDAGEDDGICWALLHTDDANVITLRGSATFLDWIRNLLALALPFTHHQMGPVHPGFLLGLDHAWSEMKLMLDMSRPVVFTGHSLGAGRADILCGMAILDRIEVARRVCFGEPKPGFQPLAKLLQTIPGASYRNGEADGHAHDLVTNVPFNLPPEDYVHPTPLIKVTAPPTDWSWGAFAWHHMGLYVTALGA